MSKRTREKKGAKSQQPAKPDAIFDWPEVCPTLRYGSPPDRPPHSYREWNITGECDVPGFFYLESRFRRQSAVGCAAVPELRSGYFFTPLKLTFSRVLVKNTQIGQCAPCSVNKAETQESNLWPR